MPLATDIPPAPGEIVRARCRRYLVEAVTPAPQLGDQTLVRLSCLEDDAEGEELEILWEKEVDAQRIDTTDWSKLTGGQFDDPRHFGSYYHTLRWNLGDVHRPASSFRPPTARASASMRISWNRSARRCCCPESTCSSQTMCDRRVSCTTI
jgi:hypothetical protein